MRALVQGLAFLVIASCVVIFDGQMAVLKPSPEIKIVLKQKQFGDCYRWFESMPTVYTIERAEYTLTIAHGDRYWPQFYLSVASPNNVGLIISGDLIEKVQIAQGANLRSLEKTRNVVLSHRTLRLDRIAGRKGTVAISDMRNVIIGKEILRFELVNVRCKEYDGL